MSLIDILTVLLIIAAIVLSVYLIISLRKITFLFENMQRDIHTLSNKADRVLENLNRATERIDRITADAEKQWNELEDRLYVIKQKIGRFSGPSSVLDTIATVKSFSSNVMSLFKGISAFVSSWKNN